MALLNLLSKAGKVLVGRGTENGELKTRAIGSSGLEHAASLGDAYCWSSVDTDIDAGDTRLFIKNTGDRSLVLQRAVISPANVACKYDVGIGSASTTATGTVVTATNMNQTFSSKTADYVAFDDETAVADATKMFGVMSNTTESLVVPLDGIVLEKGHYIQINQETESTSGQVAIFGFFTDELI